MQFPHSKRETETHGLSPGNGTTEIPLSRDPLATEGEATPGPDDYNPYDDQESRRSEVDIGLDERSTEGDDPYAFDGVGDAVREVSLPPLDSSPSLEFEF